MLPLGAAAALGARVALVVVPALAFCANTTSVEARLTAASDAPSATSGATATSIALATSACSCGLAGTRESAACTVNWLLWTLSCNSCGSFKSERVRDTSAGYVRGIISAISFCENPTNFRSAIDFALSIGEVSSCCSFSMTRAAAMSFSVMFSRMIAGIKPNPASIAANVRRCPYTHHSSSATLLSMTGCNSP